MSQRKRLRLDLRCPQLRSEPQEQATPSTGPASPKRPDGTTQGESPLQSRRCGGELQVLGPWLRPRSERTPQQSRGLLWSHDLHAELLLQKLAISSMICIRTMRKQCMGAVWSTLWALNSTFMVVGGQCCGDIHALGSQFPQVLPHPLRVVWSASVHQRVSHTIHPHSCVRCHSTDAHVNALDALYHCLSENRGQPAGCPKHAGHPGPGTAPAVSLRRAKTQERP